MMMNVENVVRFWDIRI